MKRFLTAIIVMLVVSSAYGDLLEPEFYRNVDADMSLRVYTSDKEDNTLVLNILMEGSGTLSYTIRDHNTGRVVFSDTGKIHYGDLVTATWKYANPSRGNIQRYEVTASLDPERGRKITHTKNVTIRNNKGVINVIVN